MISSKNEAYESYYLDWASDYVQTEYIMRRLECESERAREMADSLSRVSALPWLRGKLHEKIAHKAVLLTGGQFTLESVADLVNPVFQRSLDSAEVNLEIDLGLKGFQVYAYNFADVVAITEGIYYIPAAENQASFDSFAVAGGTLYILQMTTSRKREVVETGIADVLNYVRRFNHLKLTSYKYVFVVPSDIASEYHNNKAKLVPLKTKLGGDAIEWPTEDLSFSQVVATTALT
jgi:hypothetical protein